MPIVIFLEMGLVIADASWIAIVRGSASRPAPGSQIPAPAAMRRDIAGTLGRMGLGEETRDFLPALDLDPPDRERGGDPGDQSAEGCDRQLPHLDLDRFAGLLAQKPRPRGREAIETVKPVTRSGARGPEKPRTQPQQLAVQGQSRHVRTADAEPHRRAVRQRRPGPAA